MKCQEAIDLWPLFWVAVAIGVTVYNCMQLWLDKKGGE